MADKVIYDFQDDSFKDVELSEYIRLSKESGEIPYDQGCHVKNAGMICVLPDGHGCPHIASGTDDRIYFVWEGE